MSTQIKGVFSANQTAAQAIVTCMKNEGIDKVFCVPGESYLPLLDALYDEPSIDVISARHEGGAAFMAEGYAKASLKPGIVLATRGVGATNLSIGVHTAYQDSTPMIVFLGQVDSRFRGREGFQEVDLEQYFAPIAKWAVEIKHPERVPEIVSRAFHIARSGRPGPVVISLPEDVLPKVGQMIFNPLMNVPKPAPSQREVHEIKRILSEARSPLIIAGGGIKTAEAEEVLLSFAEKNHLPVMASFRRHDVFPNDHSLYVGHLGLGTSKEVLRTVEGADVIIAIGSRLSEVTTQDYQLITRDHRLIHIDISFDTIGKVFVPELGIVSDAKEALEKLLDIELSPCWHDWVTERNEAVRKSSLLQVSEKDVINKHIIKEMVNSLPADTVITNDAGNFAGWLHSYYPFQEKHTYVGPTSGAMGYGLPAALGAKLAYPNKTVVSLSGDGGFMMTVQELETAVRYNIPVIALVFNNQSYGTIRMHQEIVYPHRVMATDLGATSFSELAKSVGAYGYRVETIEEFESALNKALKHNHMTVIEILTDVEQISVNATIEDLRKKH
ncbi:MAG TPA: thiamine pyrophosphate-binding protein [Cerasibacillus sp.]|uniref:thiamine pyrophosphate-binding protein n=1 Tax=Cerasibacillus sp. TaxID=2498711 RepID=UPI002F412D8B